MKVSKSRKQLLVFSILPKMNEKHKKNCPESSQDNACSFFVWFLEEKRIPRIALGIYWFLGRNNIFPKNVLNLNATNYIFQYECFLQSQEEPYNLRVPSDFPELNFLGSKPSV